jgi:hypothetical protein
VRVDALSTLRLLEQRDEQRGCCAAELTAPRRSVVAAGVIKLVQEFLDAVAATVVGPVSAADKQTVGASVRAADRMSVAPTVAAAVSAAVAPTDGASVA